MTFSDFLKRLRKARGLSSIKELYDFLGAEEGLGIKVRTFQQIEKGDYPPSFTVLSAVFKMAHPNEKKDLIKSFFHSSAKQANDPILDYIDKYLSPEIESNDASLWSGDRKFDVYSDEQIRYLAEHPEALVFHRKLLYLERVAMSECRIPREQILKLKALGLLEMRGKYFIPPNTLYKLPHYGANSARSVSRASDYILKQVELFVAKEGSDKQHVGYAGQMISKQSATVILEQMVSFKKWVQSMSSKSTSKEDNVPFLYVGYGKVLDWNELE